MKTGLAQHVAIGHSSDMEGRHRHSDDELRSINKLRIEKDNYLSIPLFNNYIIHLCKWYDKSHRIWDVSQLFCILSSPFSVSTIFGFVIVISHQELELEVGLAFNHATMQQMGSTGF